MEDLSPEQEEQQVIEEPKQELPKTLSLFKKYWVRFQDFTKKDASDNLWLIGLKYFLKGIMVFILILLSPFILLILGMTLLVAG